MEDKEVLHGGKRHGFARLFLFGEGVAPDAGRGAMLPSGRAAPPRGAFVGIQKLENPQRRPLSPMVYLCSFPIKKGKFYKKKPQFSNLLE